MGKKNLILNLGYLNLFYVGILPSIAIFSLLHRFGHPFIIGIFLGGIAVVGVYLTMTISYFRSTDKLGVALFVLLDGPVIAAVSQGGSWSASSMAIDTFMIDGLAAWIAIFVVIIKGDKPTWGRILGGFALTGLAVLAIFSIFWQYLQTVVLTDPFRPYWLIIGLVESAILHFRLLDESHVSSETQDISPAYIGGLTMLWVIAMFAGNAMHEMG